MAEIEGEPELSQTCGTLVRDGMVVNTETEAVKAARKAALDKLLSTHKADCFAPCRLGCPAGVDIQGYIALALRGQYTEAMKLIPDEVVEHEEEKRIFEQIKQTLTPREQIFLELYYVRELSPSEISRILNTNENNIYQLKSLVRKKMKKIGTTPVRINIQGRL